MDPGVRCSYGLENVFAHEAGVVEQLEYVDDGSFVVDFASNDLEIDFFGEDGEHIVEEFGPSFFEHFFRDDSGLFIRLR